MSVISLDELNSSTDGDSTDSQSSDSESDLREACEMVGADYDHAREYVEAHESVTEDDVAEFARTLAGDEDLWELQEEYRRMNDIHRIIRNFLRSHDLEFTAFTGEFYGNSDDPEPGTYNDVQQRSRESDGNLMWYRALFPEPVTEYWDSDAVLYHEWPEIGYDSDDAQDSHIYVTRDFVNEYSDFTMEVEGTEKPRPPANSELGEAGSGSGTSESVDAEIDPSEHTVEELRDALQDLLEGGADAETFVDILEAEVEGKNRKTARKAIKGAKNQAASRDESDDGSEQVDFAQLLEGVDASPEEVAEALQNL